ncbi:CRISPR-associated endonuclease Cas1 1 [Candidatus Propionivibrio aalborgensis]|uniref:CRISPR-associated endonuclease Cas1 n=1 Tax=Candidatus Propionivibrio aalborgensis TaxID=1860101 RepID=A0A1A8Y2A0_9RHOO|nr:type I-C CRISPR-associated endonuclease Cas1c [Candidatus Propionivibrio aalborgensis]SBT10518.1 CRISPR-associated endonuclease Cas1 1 [Candidatus Propionivibrio aalborgensis]
MQTLLNTLYVTTPLSYLHLDNDTVRVEVERETRLRVPLHHLGGVVTFGNVLVSPALMHRLADEGKTLVLLSEHGRFKARLEGPVSGNILLRQAQHARAADPIFALAASRAFVAGKIKNSRQVILRAAREAKVDDESTQLTRRADDLAAALRTLPAAGDLDTVRGIEGEAARQYFAGLNLVLRADSRAVFTMDGRSRRPPRDRMNALLSFAYAMLMNDCRSALEAVGLDPQLGFLHAVRPGRAALALDLMEEFRPLADRLVLTLVNRGQLNSNDFTEHEGGAVTLAEEGRKTVVVAWQEKKREELAHPLLEQSVAIGLLPLLQARFLARTLRGDMENYLPFIGR